MFAIAMNKIKEDYFISYIYLYIFLMPWNFSNGQMGVLSIILLIWWLIIGKKREYFSKLKIIFEFKPLLLIILFFAYSYLSLLWTDNFETAKTALKYYKYYWIMIPVLFTTLTKEQAKNGLYVFVLSIGGYALFSILIYLNVLHVFQNNISNPRGILSYSIVTIYMAIGTLSSLLISYYSKSNALKTIFLIITFLSLIGLFINNGRSGQLSFFITIFFLFIIYRKNILNIKILITIIILISTSLYLLNSFNKIDKFKYGINELKEVQNNNFSGSWGGRAYMWFAGIHIVKENPIFGTGAGDNIDEFINYTKTHPSDSTWLRSFHNQHLDTLTRYGIIGYILLWSSVFLLLYYLRDLELFFTIGIVFFSITFFSGIFDILLLMKPYNTIFMLIFLLLSIVVYKNKSINSSSV
ncbi:O-antigen polymerase [Sulfurimonas gotlandica GD1]|uniref:O-antigen polymerase n=1 Tax=Sulfurimonas gotlandica (strain DSM 19862 / JCM 16533 / GD1) TaxID=929558 RepID=B6BIX9_SULGG|nr:O-antigen ligase family protein [Sulfurimonas gotlandica]EDZ63663.1 O-Antigen Polymerase family protein [Sulfurimonas gotlandica GD1]EHP30490.1 O-antigen polymerase [Sulfurimonas gotlandica GD1]